MLKRLSVENYALIDHLEMELDAHLNIITGETGAGKSILLGALGLLLGAKNDGSAMKNQEASCRVEGTFLLKGLHLESLFEENDLEYADETILTRVISPSGKSRAFINDLPVTLHEMREIGGRLVDIHSQHQNLILSSEDFRISALDTMADAESLSEDYRQQYLKMQAVERQLAVLKENAEKGQRDEEWLRFQCEELSAAKLRKGEIAEIEEEIAILENADKIGEAFLHLHNALDGEENGILSQLHTSEHDLRHVGEQYPSAREYAERLHTIIEELKDINSSVTADSQHIEADPERLEKQSTRLDTLFSLQQKHRVSSEEELLMIQEKYEEQLSQITHADEEIQRLEEEVKQAQQKAQSLADQLHQKRQAAIPAFQQRIEQTLSKLGMPDTVFQIESQPTMQLTRYGAETIQYLFTANRNHPPQPIEKIASGGELSRVMLSLKAMLAERMSLPTIIFDEIDTGVSGRIADAMGEIIANLSQNMQVVDITHLPQVASKGASHFVVYKEEGRTSIKHLTEEERITEIAKMLSGSEITDAAYAQAKILLSK